MEAIKTAKPTKAIQNERNNAMNTMHEDLADRIGAMLREHGLDFTVLKDQATPEAYKAFITVKAYDYSAVDELEYQFRTVLQEAKVDVLKFTITKYDGIGEMFFTILFRIEGELK